MTNITLKTILVNSIYNDLGFHVKNKSIILVESQSTFSYNILVRLILYLAETYKKYCEDYKINIYGTKQIDFPEPEFYVLYTKECDKKQNIISLKKDFHFRDNADLDVKVHLIYQDNSNTIINQYISFCIEVDKQIKEYGRTKEAIEEAIKKCIAKNILKDYLLSHQKEVKSSMEYLFNQREAFDLCVRDEIKEAEEKTKKAEEKAKREKEKAKREKERAKREKERAKREEEKRKEIEYQLNKAQELIKKLTGQALVF